MTECVICTQPEPRHGGLCCAHRYDEQPPCPECPVDLSAVDRPESTPAASLNPPTEGA